MKRYLLILLFSPFLSLKAQDKLQAEWKIDLLIGINNLDEYNLMLFSHAEEYHYGNQVIFNKDGTFTAFYTAPCGNDCFLTNSGTYNWIDSDHVKLHIDSISTWGMCRNGNSYPNKDIGTFLVNEIEHGIVRLIRTSDEEPDEVRLKYADILYHINSSRLVLGLESDNWINLDLLSRESEDIRILEKGLETLDIPVSDDLKILYTGFVNSYAKVYIFRNNGVKSVAAYARGPEVFTILKDIKVD